MGKDIGAFTPFIHALREREHINDLIEELCGARLTFNYMRIGGVGWDLLPATWRGSPIPRPLRAADRRVQPPDLVQQDLRRAACQRRGDQRQRRSTTIRRSEPARLGLKWDVRRDLPYSIYPELEFDVPVGTGERHARRLLRPLHGAHPRNAGELQDPPPVPGDVSRGAGDRQGAAQVQAAGRRRLRTGRGARGDMGWYFVSDGSDYPYRVQIRTGSFTAMSIIDKVSRGLMLADLIAVIGSLDLVAPEIDR